MGYSGSGPFQNDEAFDVICIYVLDIKERMFQSVTDAIKVSKNEQSLIASLKLLRIINDNFPLALNVSFGKKAFYQAKELFEEWYQAVGKKIPKKYREGVYEEAQKEFALWEEMYEKQKAT